MKTQNQKRKGHSSLLRLMLYGKNNLLIRLSSARGGFGKFVSPFLEIIETKGWNFFCEHKALGFATLAREFYSNMVEIMEYSVYVQGVWVPSGHKKIYEIFKLKELKHGSKFEKLVEKPDHEKDCKYANSWKGKMAEN